MTRAELRWLLLASLAVLLFASLPTIYAWSQADDGHVFTGFVYNNEDGNSYIAKMRLGARGEWLFHLPYTPEEHEGALVYPFYLILGKVAAGLRLSHVLVYHLARVLLGGFLLLTVYLFVSAFTLDVTGRRLAWVLVAVGSGLGWMLTLLGATDWLGNLPLDFWVPEAYAFLVLYNLPHVALGEAALLWSLLWTLRSFESGKLRWSLAAALAALVMSAILPFYAGILAAALGAYLVALWLRRWRRLRRRRLPWREVGLTALTGLGALPPVAYNAWVFVMNPAFGIWASQNRIRSPHPFHYLLGFGLLLLPAIGGAVAALREDKERWLLPGAWVLVVPLLLYLPFNLQRRMSAAVQVPLALLAAVGLVAWLGKRRSGLVAYAGLVSLSNLLLVAGSLGPIARQAEPIFHPAAEMAAMHWLASNSAPGETALAAFETGNTIPAYTDLRVFAGHGPETLYNEEKKQALERFFDAATDDGWRQALLEEYGVDYVFYGPRERGLGDWDPDEAGYLTPILVQDGYAIYRFIPGASGGRGAPGPAVPHGVAWGRRDVVGVGA